MVGFCKVFPSLLTAGLIATVCSADNSVRIPRAIDPLAYEALDAGSPFSLRGGSLTECAQGAGNCQQWDRETGTAGRSSDLVGIAALGGDDFKTADNFTPTANGSITSICFSGFYSATTGSATQPTAGNEAFRIRILRTTGGANPGIPDESNIVANLVVGANPGYGLTVTPGTTLTRLPQSTAATRPGVFSWNVALGTPVPVTAGTCYWLEIVGATNGIAEGDRFRWAISNVANATSGDNVFYQGVHSANFDYVDLIGNAGDPAYCLNIALGANSNCNIPAAPANGTCATAQTITAPFSATRLNTLRATTAATPFCGNNPVNANTIWFRVVGDGSTFTASTCGANTNFDTVINVYCSTGGACGTGNANLNCVANNDTGPAACTGATGSDPSQVTWASAPGLTYYVAVFGFEVDAGFLDFSLTSAPGTAGPACASDRCPVTLPAQVETDACGASTNSAAICNGGTGGSFTLGTAFGGTSYNLGNTRDFDFWELSGAVPDTTGNGTAWLNIQYSVEFPGIFNFFSGPCAGNNGTFLGGAFANYLDGGPGCPAGGRTASTQIEAPAGQAFRLNLLPVDFGGVPCGAGNNNYKITVTVATLGACCIPATACFLTVSADCADQGGNFLASSTTCGPTDPCTAPPTGACCSGSTCSVQANTNCSGANTRFAGVGTVCNAAGNNTTPCCKADYNQSGAVSVQDIFDFLSGYFSANPQADINGNGSVTVQDIFDFLAAYFAGCA